MELTRRHLAPIFQNIVKVLCVSPGQLELFEPWAIEQARKLRKAAEHSKLSLTYEADLLREELAQLSTPSGPQSMAGELDEQIRWCKSMWLTGLLDVVDDLLDEAESAAYPWAA